MPNPSSKSSRGDTRPAKDIQAMFGAQTGNPPILSEGGERVQMPVVRAPSSAGKPKGKKATLRVVQDGCCSIVPYFKVSKGKLSAFQKLCEQFVMKTRQEPKCLYYGFSFNGDEVHCREGYADAESLLGHLQNVGPLLEEALKISKITRLEIHGPKEALAKLRKPLAKLKPQFFTLAYGFRR